MSDMAPSFDELFDYALDLDVTEREDWLASLTCEHPQEAERIRAALAARDSPDFDAFLEGPPLLSRAQELTGSLIGRAVGPYVIDAELGRGGMGSVWRARRADGRYEGTVAIKFVHASWIGRAGEQRFRMEGELLARLHHPNIARLLDAGVIDAAQPYLILEYVEGAPIDAYCDRHSLGIEARIRLFLDVLAAVGHAHSHLIVHRDLKPSNVFVTADGTVKLLDFGVAKLLEADAGSLALTRSAAVALTPQYAAPEQLLGTAITTATDVYALGLVLYVMLVGLHPFARNSRTGADLLRATAHDERPRASVLAASRASDGALTRDAAVRAAQRGSTPRQLSAALAGDLDNILGRALAVSPAERYASASDFAADLRRFLAHEPVQAHAPSWRYRFTKLLRRRPLESALVAAVVVAVGAGLAATLWQWRIAEVQRAAAVEQRERAERMLLRTAAANDFTTSLLTEMAQVSRPVRFSDIIERGEKLALDSGGDPVQRAHALLALAYFYLATNNNAKGEELTRRAAGLALGAGDRALSAIADCMQGFALTEQGQRAAGEALEVRGLALAGDDPEASYRCYEERAHIEQSVSNGPQMLKFARKALEIASGTRWVTPSARAGLMDLVGAGESLSGNFAAANRYFDQALDLLSRAGLSGSIEAATVLGNVAFILDRQGQARAAMEARQRVFNIWIAIAGEDGVAVALLNNLARGLLKLHRLDEAAVFAQRGRDKAAQAHSETSSLTANVTLANVRREQHRFAEAQQALDEARRHAGPQTPGTTAASMVPYAQAELLLDEGKPLAALAALDALQADMDAYAQRSGSRAVIGIFGAAMALTRAQALADSGHLREGIACAEQAVALSRKAQGAAPISSDTGGALLLLAELGAKANGPRAVSQMAREAARNLTEALGADDPQAVRARELLAEAAQ